MLRIYQLLILILLPVVVLRLIYRSIREPAYRDHLVERFGWVGDYPTHDVWIHAVSAGETIAAEALIRSLLEEGRSIVLTVTTPAGREAAHRLFGPSITLVYAPYDVPFCVNRFLRSMAPRAALIIETEIWPGWLAALGRQGIPAALINGRLSEKSYRRYARAKGLIQAALQSLALVGCQSEAHRERFLALGARESSARTLGSIKFDAGLPPDFQEDVGRTKHRLGPEPVLLAASTHAPEESFCLTAFKALKSQYPSLRLVLAPRHVHRASGLVNDAVSAGFKAKVTSQNGLLSDVDVVVLDEMGQLLTWYGVAQAAFIGGTLIDHGGHNFMEAAAAECPVIVGQSLYNFESMAALFLAERAMVQVQDEQALGTALGQLLSDDEERSRLSDSALRLVHRESGALDRTRAALIAANVLPDIAKGSER